MGLRNVGDQIKVVTITKVPTREIVEQTRSVAEMANICCSDSVMVSWSMTLVAARGEGFQCVKVISSGRYEPRGSSWFNKAKLACDRPRTQMIVDLPAGTYFWVMIHLRKQKANGSSRYGQSTILPAYYPQRATKGKKKPPK